MNNNFLKNFMAAILFFAHKTFSPRVPSWHLLDSGSGRSSDGESAKKHHIDSKTRFYGNMPNLIQTIFFNVNDV